MCSGIRSAARTVSECSRSCADSPWILTHSSVTPRSDSPRIARRYLIVAKFLPGVNPLAAGLAGVVGLRPASFLLYAAAGALLWAGAWIMLGYLCADVIAAIATWNARFVMPLVIGAAVALILYIAIKYAMRRRFLRHLQKARIDPIELKRRMEAGDPVAIVDLRTELDIETTPYGIPGARWIPPEMLRDPHQLDPERQRGRLLLRGSERGDECSNGPPAELSRLQKPPASQRWARRMAPRWLRRRTPAWTRPVSARRSSS